MNVYEQLLWYNGTSGSQVIPWLAQNYTVSPNGKTVSFTLRSGIKFADGEPFNSTAVYFSLNRLLILDASSPVGHGTQLAWIIQQLVNKSLSSALCGCSQSYTQAWANQVLGQDFVQITGPLTFTLNLQVANPALPYLLSNPAAAILAPDYVMQHDIQLWSQASNDYTLPYPTPSGNATNAINQYFYDEVATCNAGATPKGCGATYLEPSTQGSEAGTGPYAIQSVSSTGDIVLSANPNYWGGPYQFSGGQKIVPQIQTIYINYVPQLSTREVDLTNAGKSGQAMTIDVPASNLYDVADRSSWVNSNQLVSTVQGVSLYGPYTAYATDLNTLDTNVTNPHTGTLYTFQPFADVRLRLAFTDSVNMSEINADYNNGLGSVATQLIPPGEPPAGSHNDSITNAYSYNLTAVQDLLLSAMMQPLTHFTFVNGTTAPPGVFDNSFGCTTLNSQNMCNNPIGQTITLNYDTGDTVEQAIASQMASAINNVSATFNMGLTVSIVPVPFGQLFTLQISGQTYWGPVVEYPDYPWALDYVTGIYPPGEIFTTFNNFNLTQMATLYSEALQASASNNVKAMQAADYAMFTIGNKIVMYQWTLYPKFFYVITSNVQGFYFNPAISMLPTGYYFATMY